MYKESLIFFLSLGTMLILVGVIIHLNEIDNGVEDFEVILTDYPAELVKINNSYGEIEITEESYLFFTSNASYNTYKITFIGNKTYISPSVIPNERNITPFKWK